MSQPQPEKTKQVQEQVDEVIGIMQNNIEKVKYCFVACVRLEIRHGLR